MRWRQARFGPFLIAQPSRTNAPTLRGKRDFHTPQPLWVAFSSQFRRYSSLALMVRFMQFINCDDQYQQILRHGNDRSFGEPNEGNSAVLRIPQTPVEPIGQ